MIVVTIIGRKVWICQRGNQKPQRRKSIQWPKGRNSGAGRVGSSGSSYDTRRVTLEIVFKCRILLEKKWFSNTSLFIELHKPVISCLILWFSVVRSIRVSSFSFHIGKVSKCGLYVFPVTCYRIELLVMFFLLVLE
jgi:hypothetical protein